MKEEVDFDFNEILEELNPLKNPKNSSDFKYYSI